MKALKALIEGSRPNSAFFAIGPTNLLYNMFRLVTLPDVNGSVKKISGCTGVVSLIWDIIGICYIFFQVDFVNVLFK